MSYKRKFKKGSRIKSLNELMSQEFIYFGDKITHNGWFSRWQLSMAKTIIDRGMLFKANKVR